ncbi:hypothetical protein SELMODRAFT_233315 [Selaginella moellendorffii]|uniref:Peptidyl-prolyl cis-trans isomerase n=1 Tax=Selaginella moellendorffii TaxID=88036 RepID=D8S7M2_SELML|nr:hypothetical protein SELMODRAFT_233315 [Selaginella moellendorffii]
MGCVLGAARDNPKCYLDISAAGESLGRLVIELRKDVVPRTAENFRGLCTGEYGACYRGSSIHRIVPGYVAQARDLDLYCGKSIYGKRFEDENFKLLHTSKGTLSMANNGPHTNGTQFFISLGKCKQLDGKHVVFGKVIQGIELLDSLGNLGSSEGRTIKEVKIHDCGELVQ